MSNPRTFYQRDDLEIPVTVLTSKNPSVVMDLTGKAVTNIVGRLQRVTDMVEDTVDPIEVTGVVTNAAAGLVTYTVSSAQTALIEPGVVEFQPEMTIDGKRGTLQNVPDLVCKQALRDV